MTRQDIHHGRLKESSGDMTKSLTKSESIRDVVSDVVSDVVRINKITLQKDSRKKRCI